METSQPEQSITIKSNPTSDLSRKIYVRTLSKSLQTAITFEEIATRTLFGKIPAKLPSIHSDEDPTETFTEEEWLDLLTRDHLTPVNGLLASERAFFDELTITELKALFRKHLHRVYEDNIERHEEKLREIVRKNYGRQESKK